MTVSFGPMGQDGRLYPMQGAVSYSQLPTLPVLAGVVWLMQPIVRVLKPDGSLDAAYAGPVTVSSPDGLLSGTTTVLAVAGLATFIGLKFAAAGAPTLVAEVAQRGMATTAITVS